MSRYPRDVRDSQFKCIPCNAPVVETTSDLFVCVECGGEPIQRSRTRRMKVKQLDIHVVRSIQRTGADRVVSYEIRSNCTNPVGARLLQPLDAPATVPLEGIDGQNSWFQTDNGLEFRGYLLPNATIETSLPIPEDFDPSTLFESPPWIADVDPVDPETVDVSGAPIWRGSGSTTRSGTPTRANGSGVEESNLEARTTHRGSVNETGGGTTAALMTAELSIGSEAHTSLPEPTVSESVSTTRPSSYLLPPDSAREPTISVVLPTMNEEEGIGPCIEAVESALAELEVYGEVVVSDSSADRTEDIARSYGVHVVTPERKGYGAAYQHGFDHARGEYLVMGDADTTYDFEELPKLFKWVESGDADLVMGSRFAGEIKDGAMPLLHRKIGNPLLTRFLNTFYAANVTDAHSGFRVITREALDELNLRSDGMEFASEMVMAASERGMTIGEVPITYHPRVGEAKLDSLADGWRHVKFMLTNTPAHVFSIPAVGLMAVGLLTMLLALLDLRLFGVTFGTHAVIAGSLLTIIGYQVASLGVFSSVAGTAVRAPKDPVTAFIRNRVTLEHGTTIGVAMYAVGAVYVTAMVVRWMSSGFSSLPFVDWNMVAFTLIVLGVQTVFYSFFLSLLGQRST